MALAKVGLGTVTRVALGTTATVLTVGSAKTCYIRSVILHNIDSVNSSTVRIHVVPNSGGSAGTASSINQLAQLSIQPTDTYFFERRPSGHPAGFERDAMIDSLLKKFTQGVNHLLLAGPHADHRLEGSFICHLQIEPRRTNFGGSKRGHTFGGFSQIG